MSGLFQSLSVGSQALFATRQGIDTTAHNVANAHTEGYSRQRVELSQHDPLMSRGVLIGNGVRVGGVRRSYDSFIERQLNRVNSSFGQSEARDQSINEVESIFSPELSSTLSQEMDQFFGSLQTLANFPEELTARTAVRENGRSLAVTFRQVDLDLNRVRSNLNEQVRVHLSESNNIVKNISRLNLKINGIEIGSKSPANDLHDQRDRLVRKLATLMDVNYYNDKHGMLTVRGPGDVLLVEGGQSASFDVMRSDEENGVYRIIARSTGGGQFEDITDSVEGGTIGGILEVRDLTVANLIDSNNEMANVFVGRFNEIHRNGFGLSEYAETQGRNFFKAIKDPNRAAYSVELSDVIENSTNAISAASQASSPGDNVNLNQMVDLKYQRVFNEGGATFTEFYSDYIGELGIQALRAKHLLESDKVLEAEWTTRREAISGVSLDEEAANLIRWQTAFTASSKVITTVDEMLETVLRLKR